ncbi:MAG: efflux system, outer rane lipoprotein NodT family [Betaproteobacteria bacterium]|nr:efflux system, outer rane lipoprotein NodT family [Betaproteobacteria bacterium]
MKRSSLTLRPLASALLLAGAATLGGCMLIGPDYKRPSLETLDVPADYPEPQAGEATVLQADWWTLYGDATLNDLVASAQKNSADIRLATAQLEEARAALREANASLFPEIDAGVSDNSSRVSTVTAVPVPSGIPLVRPDKRLAISTAFELDFWGRLRRGTEAARAVALSSQYGRDTVTITLAATTSQAYFLLRAIDAQIVVTRETLKAREDSLEVTRDRSNSGISSDLDVQQAIGARSDAILQLQELERQRKIVEHQLGVLTGNLALRIAPGNLDNLPAPPVPPTGLPSALLERRPDVRSAEQNLVAANARIGIAKAAMFPTISLTGYLGGESTDFSNLLSMPARIWNLGFAMTLPLFDEGRIFARTAQAEARQRQSVANYQRSVETAFRETADAVSNLYASTQSEAEYKVKVEAARQALVLSRTRYDAGYSAYLEVLDAQRTANDAELAMIRNRQLRLAYSVDLMRALGGGWNPEAPR